MRGDIYSNMPDTTYQVSPYRRSLRRLTASTLLFVSSLLLVASMGLAQDGSDFEGDSLSVDPESAICEDFDSPEAAAEFATNNPDTELALDGDGNGIVCDEDPELFANGDEDFSDEDTNNNNNGNNFDNNDFSNTGNQYADGSDNYVNQTPNTGGVALLPLAGSALTALLGGFTLIRHR